MLALCNAEADVLRMLDRWRPFEEIEDYIDSLYATDEEKSVLWLLAWSELPRATRRTIIRG
jgi:hypothetical protein